MKTVTIDKLWQERFGDFLRKEINEVEVNECIFIKSEDEINEIFEEEKSKAGLGDLEINLWTLKDPEKYPDGEVIYLDIGPFQIPNEKDNRNVYGITEMLIPFESYNIWLTIPPEEHDSVKRALKDLKLFGINSYNKIQRFVISHELAHIKYKDSERTIKIPKHLKFIHKLNYHFAETRANFYAFKRVWMT